jgi:hypothetical protein
VYTRRTGPWLNTVDVLVFDYQLRLATVGFLIKKFKSLGVEYAPVCLKGLLPLDLRLFFVFFAPRRPLPF